MPGRMHTHTHPPPHTHTQRINVNIRLTELILSNVVGSPWWNLLNLLMIISNEAVSKSSSVEIVWLACMGIVNNLTTSIGFSLNKVELTFVHCKFPLAAEVGGYTSASMTFTQLMHSWHDLFLADGFLFGGHFFWLEQGRCVCLALWCHKSMIFWRHGITAVKRICRASWHFMKFSLCVWDILLSTVFFVDFVFVVRYNKNIKSKINNTKSRKLRYYGYICRKQESIETDIL